MSETSTRASRTGWGGLLEGARVTAVSAGLIAASMGLLLVLDGAGQDGVRATIRLSARTSLLLFVLAFSASGAARFLAGGFSAWQLRNRRYLGLAFAASHGLHGLAILSYAQLYPSAFAEHTRTTAIGPGLFAYALIAAMAATSNDRAVAWLGPRAWKVLHVLGGFVIWVAFFKATFTRTGQSAGYWLPVVVLLAALALRLASWLPVRAPSRAS